MREEFYDLLDPKMSAHDRHRFELKMDIDLAPGRKNVYRVETYIFIPRALNITPHTYDKTVFYNSSQKYIRFKTPQMSLEKICDKSVESSPLNRAEKSLSALLAGSKDKEILDTLQSEIKLLGCIVRSYLRDNVRGLKTDISALGSGDAVALSSLAQRCETFLADIRVFVSRLRQLRIETSSPLVPARIKDTFAFFDEYISLILVEYLTGLLQALRDNEYARTGLSAADADICTIVHAQNSYRQSMHYPSLVKRGTLNETLVYRRGVLKKFMSSVLYLHIETSEWEGAIQFFFGISAGVAMLFTAVVMLFAQRRYSANSVPFIALAVISYIFKDRMKDWLKIWFTRRWTSWIADRQTEIKDYSNGQTLGMFKEAFSFVSPGKIPQEIMRRRNIDNISSIDGEGKPERVMKYEKEVTLYPASISRFHERRHALNDILRFNVIPLLSQADDPNIDYLHLAPGVNVLETIPCLRVYHLNVITKYVYTDINGAEKIALERVRIVVTRDGILRLEKVAG